MPFRDKQIFGLRDFCIPRLLRAKQLQS